ncbi:MAG: hydrogenase maturation protease [Anaerolineales bacterium]|nr:hydrogenase maturation protease [Anaerolineales bacterium]
MSIVLIGIGQSLRRDDGAGPRAVRLWQAQHPGTAARVRVEVSELPGLGLLALLAGMQAALIVDAARLDTAAPGTLVRLGPDELAAFTPGSESAHGWGVAETLQLGRKLDPALGSCRITLIGIVGADFGMGAGLSPFVEQALTEAVAQIEQTIRNLLSSNPQE